MGQNQIKSNRFSVVVKESFKKLSFAKKENSLHVFEKWQFFAQLQRPLTLYHEPKSIKNNFTKNIALSVIFHIPH